jgi:hypothetical protein
MRLASVAFATLLVGSANAMPTPAPYHGDSAITLAAGGCGLAFHRNVYGGCVPNGYGWGGGPSSLPDFMAAATATTAATIMAAAGTEGAITGTTAVFTAGDGPRAQSLRLRPKRDGSPDARRAYPSGVFEQPRGPALTAR